MFEENLSRKEFIKKTFLFTLSITTIQPVYNFLKGLFNKEKMSIYKYEAKYYERLPNNKVRCHLCFRECVVNSGSRGVCKNRENKDGKYYNIVYARPSALQVDPIEKEPCFHMLPGTNIFCIGTSGCNNRCQFCHNWHLSQRSIEEISSYDNMTPSKIIEMAKKYKCRGISFTYNDPIAFYEYVFDIVKMVKKNNINLKTLVHTNGLFNKESLIELLKYLDAITIDLKAFTERFYNKICSSSLKPVLQTLENIRKTNVHLEVVNLVIPTLNDDMKDVKNMVRWLSDNVGNDTPLHFTRFFPAYRLTNLPPTPINTLENCYEIAKSEGLKYVYVGNVPGHLYNSTYCPNCNKRIIYRVHFEVLENHIINGKCNKCGYKITGLWT